MKTITFRNQLVDSEQQRIKLATLKGKTGYRIKKFQVISSNPVSENDRWVVKIYNVEQTTAASVTIDFSDNTLLGVGVFSSHSSSQTYPEDMTIVFDNVTFNQDIYVLAKAESGTAINYYLELEVVDLNDLEATFHTLQNIRTVAERTA